MLILVETTESTLVNLGREEIYKRTLGNLQNLWDVRQKGLGSHASRDNGPYIMGASEAALENTTVTTT